MPNANKNKPKLNNAARARMNERRRNLNAAKKANSGVAAFLNFFAKKV
jgi:hypothetical protein